MTILDAVSSTSDAIAVDDRYVARNYSPLPVVAASAEGAWITDVEGRRYLDCLAAYSAVNFGHRNPEIVAAAHAQLDTVTLVSRAFHSDRLRAAGFRPIGVDLSELLKGGGSVKCCTLEVHP